MPGSSKTTSPGGTEATGGETFVALDFETADQGADSACALAMVRVEGLRITGRRLLMIRPPRARIVFQYIHGISWGHVRDQPTFGERWPEIDSFLAGAAFLAAHNAPFDRSVLEACCRAAAVAPPEHPFRCTVRLARRAWSLRRANLPAVCEHLGIELRHHDPASDAEACARIVIAAREQGLDLGPPLVPRRR
jgi:DNA polymerase-3 subunit epsilon